MAQATGVSRTAIYHWPDPLTENLRLKVLGAAVDRGLLQRIQPYLRNTPPEEGGQCQCPNRPTTTE